MCFNIGDKVKRNTAIIQKIGQSRLKIGMVGTVVEINSITVVIEFYDKDYRQYNKTCVQKRFLTLAHKPVTAKQIETKLEELKKPDDSLGLRFIVIPEPIFTSNEYGGKTVKMDHGSGSRQVYTTLKAAEESAEAITQVNGHTFVVMQFVSRISRPPVIKSVKEIYT
jgi:hypothetical protein